MNLILESVNFISPDVRLDIEQVEWMRRKREKILRIISPSKKDGCVHWQNVDFPTMKETFVGRRNAIISETLSLCGQ